MKRRLNFTLPTALVLRAILEGYQYGFDIMEATGLPSGTVYPILRRLEGRRLLRSHWENESLAQQEQRPPRKYYRITRQGSKVLLQAESRFPVLGQMVPARAGARQAGA